MSRVPKYKAWSKRMEMMIPNEVMVEAGRQLVIFAKRMRPNMPDGQNAKGGLLLPTDDDDLVFLQYTGLKDRNGREIYEGDIVQGEQPGRWHAGVDKVLGAIRWSDYTSGFVVDGFGQLHRVNEIEVIGNKYENPELIGGEAGES